MMFHEARLKHARITIVDHAAIILEMIKLYGFRSKQLWFHFDQF